MSFIGSAAESLQARCAVACGSSALLPPVVYSGFGRRPLLSSSIFKRAAAYRIPQRQQRCNCSVADPEEVCQLLTCYLKDDTCHVSAVECWGTNRHLQCALCFKASAFLYVAQSCISDFQPFSSVLLATMLQSLCCEVRCDFSNSQHMHALSKTYQLHSAASPAIKAVLCRQRQKPKCQHPT